MPDAIQTLTAELQEFIYSGAPQNVICTIQNLINALNEIETTVGGGPYLPLAGGSMTGNINMGLSQVAGAAGSYLQFNGTGAAELNGATGQGVQLRENGTVILQAINGGAKMATGAFTPVSTSGIVGTTTNDNANAGSIGEVIRSSIVSGSSVPLTAATPANVTSLSLTAGDWDVWAKVAFNGITGGSSYGPFRAGINTVSATLPSPETESYSFISYGTAGVLGASAFLSCVPTRISIAATTTVYLVAQNDTTAGVGAYGTLIARRAR